MSTEGSPKIVERGSFTVVGVVCLEPPLMIYAWIALAARRDEIEGIEDPHMLYGVWHRTPDHEGPGSNACLVGFQVAEAVDVPDGLAAYTVPAVRFAAFKHRGHIGHIGATYDRIGTWFRARPEVVAQRPPGVGAIEVYDTRQPIAGDYEFTILEPVLWM